MGAGSKWIAASSGENCFGSCETHKNNLSRRQKENRGGAAGTLGEGEGGDEEGCLNETSRCVLVTAVSVPRC